MIKKLTRGSVVFEFEGKTATLLGEGYVRGHGSPDWVIYENSIGGWDPPHHEEPINDAAKARLLAALLEAFHARGISAVVE